MPDDERFGGVGHLKFAAHDDEEGDRPGPRVDQHLAEGDTPAPSACGDPCDLRIGQDREQPFGRRGCRRPQRRFAHVHIIHQREWALTDAPPGHVEEIVEIEQKDASPGAGE